MSTGLGISIHGTHTIAVSTSQNCVVCWPAYIGNSTLPNRSGISMSVSMTEGAAADHNPQSSDHFSNISASMYPNSTHRKISSGRNYRKKSMQLRKKIALSAFAKSPNVMCVTPMMTASFILRLFTKARELLATLHTGSRPKGYTQLLRRGTSWPSLLH